MPATTTDHGIGRGLTKPKSKLRLRLGLTPPHPTTKTNKSAKTKQQPPLPSVPTPAPISAPLLSPTLPLGNSTSTTGGISRIDSRSAFTYDNYSPTSASIDGRTRHDDQQDYETQLQIRSSPSLAFETISLNTELNNSMSTLMDPALAQHYYPTPSVTASGNGDHSFTTEEEVEDDAGLRHPHLREMIAASDDIFYLSDKQLGERFCFVEEIGFGNWGSVWKVRPRHTRASQVDGNRPGGRMGRIAAASGGVGANGKIAIKLVHRQRTAVTAARVRALWGEMKIIRQLRSEPHPSVIQFEAFVISDSFALVIMPYLSHLIPVCLSPERAAPYFRQLCSAVGYLHERGITHNDIKPANVMLSYNDVPVLVDFGFANKWQMGERGSFLSDISWGTPEYLDPQRAKGMPHDERASDVWSLGITIYEILIRRTPFEENEEEDFQDPDQYLIYYERTRKGDWLGHYNMPDDLQHLIRSMVCPDPAFRITAMQAYHHPALQPAVQAVFVTPSFVREATHPDVEEDPLPPIPYEQSRPHSHHTLAGGNSHTHTYAQGAGEEVKRKKIKVKKTKDRTTVNGHHQSTLGPRSATPTALGESIKQHTSAAKPKRDNDKVKSGHGHGKGKGREDIENASNHKFESPKKGSKLVIKNMNHRWSDVKADEEDPTPTKITKPAQPLRIKDLTQISKAQPRTSASENSSLSRPVSGLTSTSTSNRDSTISTSATKDEAMLKTMSSLEGKRLRKIASSRDVLGRITRPAPKPPLNGEVDGESRPGSTIISVPVEGRTSGVMSKVEEVDENAQEIRFETTMVQTGDNPTFERVSVEVTLSPARPAPASKRESLASPPRHRRGLRPGDIVHAEEEAEAEAEALAETKLKADQDEKEQQARKESSEIQNDLPRVTFPTANAGSSSLPQKEGTEVLAGLRQKILNNDQEQVVRFRKVSGDLMRPSMEHLKDPEPRESSERVTGTPLIASLSRTKSLEALAMDTRLDKLSEWVKGVEHIIGEARKALAEGREPPLPLLTLPTEMANHPEVLEIQHQFGLTPKGSSAVPAHLRTSSTQVEPATPPKWMTFAEAEEKVKEANKAWSQGSGEEVQFKKNKKERPTVSHVMKLFGQGDKDRTSFSEQRSNTPEPTLTVPLKPPALRGVPSTPALRSSTTRNVPQRKSESNLRNSRQFNTMPTLHSVSPEHQPNSNANPHPFATGAESRSPPASSHPFATKQRGVYEQLLDSTPGIIRQGEGWSSRGMSEDDGELLVPPRLKGRMGKTSSMLSLREKARAFLGGPTTSNTNPNSNGNDTHGEDRGSKRESKGKMVQWSSSTTTIPISQSQSQIQTQPQGQGLGSMSQRPGPPGAASGLSMSTGPTSGVPVGGQKKKGIFKSLRWGKNHD